MLGENIKSLLQRNETLDVVVVKSEELALESRRLVVDLVVKLVVKPHILPHTA
jgi:hypothetical protein